MTDVEDVYVRIISVADHIEELAEDAARRGEAIQFHRLEGKRQGLLLAADYLRGTWSDRRPVLDLGEPDSLSFPRRPPPEERPLAQTKVQGVNYVALTPTTEVYHHVVEAELLWDSGVVCALDFRILCRGREDWVQPNDFVRRFHRAPPKGLRLCKHCEARL